MISTFPQLRFLAPNPLLAGDLGDAGDAWDGDMCVGGERWGCAESEGWGCDAGLFGGIGHVVPVIEVGGIGQVALFTEGSSWDNRNIELVNNPKC